jgi:hypothetical protein
MHFHFTPCNSRPRSRFILHYICQYEIIKEDEIGRACSTHGEEEACIKGFGGKARRKETTRIRPRRRWEDNIKIDLKYMGWDGLDWIHLAQDRDQCRVLVNKVMNLQVP